MTLFLYITNLLVS